MAGDEPQDRAAICAAYGVEPVRVGDSEKVGISPNVREGLLPIHGVRVRPENGTTGWYIWAGEYSDDPNFFVPLHVEHLAEWCPLADRFLLLPPGWRFLTDGEHVDVWFDPDVDVHA